MKKIYIILTFILVIFSGNISKASSTETFYKLDNDIFGSIGDRIRIEESSHSGKLKLNDNQIKEIEENGYINTNPRSKIIYTEYGHIYISRFYKDDKFVDTIFLKPTGNTGGLDINFSLNDRQEINIQSTDFYTLVGDKPVIGLKDRIDINSFYTNTKKIISACSYKIKSEETVEELYVFSFHDKFGNISKYIMQTVGELNIIRDINEDDTITTTYNTRIPGIEVASETLNIGEFAKVPEEPIYEPIDIITGSYKKYFGGWFYDNRTHCIPMDFTKPIYQNTNLYISWCDSLRLSGENRYETSRMVARKFEKSDYAIFVNGNSYADALAASSLANTLNAPLFLIDKDSLHYDDLAVLKYLKVKKAYIVGSENSVSNTIVKRLKLLLGNSSEIKRINGNNRVETSINVGKELVNLNKNTDSVILASGENFADALSATTLSNRYNSPILYVNSENVDNSVEEFITKNNIDHIYIVGGNNSVTEKVEDIFPSINTKRFSGINRYETSAKVVEYSNFNIHSIVLVSGENFPDGLVAGPYAGLIGQAVVLTPPTNTPDPLLIKYIKKTRVHEVIIIGGEKWITDETQKNIVTTNAIHH